MKIYGVFLVVLLGINCLSAEEVSGTVTAHKLNVRVKPSTRFTAVGSLKKGNTVKIFAAVDEWYEIQAPADSEVWIAKPFVDVEASVVKKRIKLRSGPGVAYAPFCEARKGMKIEILPEKSPGRDNWLKIKPPEDLKAWVSSMYIKVDKDTKISEKKAEKENSKAKESDLTEKKKIAESSNSAKEKGKSGKVSGKNKEINKNNSSKSLSDSPLPFLKGVSKTHSYTGVLLPLKPGSVFVTHALAIKVDDEYYPLCYIHCKRSNLNLWVEKRITAEGTERWVKGWERPVLIVDKIQPSLGF